MQDFTLLFLHLSLLIIGSTASPVSQFSPSQQPSHRSFMPNFRWMYQQASAPSYNSYVSDSHVPNLYNSESQTSNFYTFQTQPSNSYASPFEQSRHSFYDLPSASHFLSDSEDIVDVSVDDIHTTNTTMNHCNCACGQVDRKQRIVGGNVTKLHEFPWIAALSKKGRFYCGATLIAKRHVLTAAHCVEGVNPKDIKVTLGEHDRLSKNESVPVIIRKVKRTIPHPDFSLSNFNNDIAVLELESGVDFEAPQIHPACLPEDNDANYIGKNGIVAGWGRLDERKPTSATLRKVEVPILSEEECKNVGYSAQRITKNMMCAGYPEGKRDSCQGDSGGPMQILSPRPGKMEVIGIVSWGRGCARPNYPGVYTRVGNYLNWIHAQLGDDCTCNL
uniref:Serine proteinase stubble n=1 Tax=Cacopsylla melanoneura TaxID=428564 RepID=A0A8D9E7P1_9HEMI